MEHLPAMRFSADLDGPLTARNFDARTCPLRRALLAVALRDLQPDDAENCVQEALCAAYDLRERFDPATGQSGLWRWLMTLLRRSTAEFFRQLNRRAEELHPCDDFPPETLAYQPLESEETLARWNDLGHRLGRVVLNDRQLAILRAWLNGETQEEIAQVWSVTPPTIHYHLETIIRRLKAQGEIELGEHAEWLFAQMAEVTIYRRPVGVWDRRGNVEQVQQRRTKGIQSCP